MMLDSSFAGLVLLGCFAMGLLLGAMLAKAHR